MSTQKISYHHHDGFDILFAVVRSETQYAEYRLDPAEHYPCVAGTRRR